MSSSPTSALPPGGDSAAVIGLGCLFPGRPGVAGFWSVVKNGLDTMSGIPSDRFNAADWYDPDPKARDRIYVKRGAFLARVPFEPLRYGISPRDMESIDSTQLLGLLAADQALADAGCPSDKADHSRTAVILGVTGALKMTVTLGQRLAHPQLRKALAGAGVDRETAQEVIERFAEQFAPWRELSFPGLLGNVTAGRIASRLNLGGANMAVDAACASSLAAVSQAVLELKSGRADLVVSGGVDTFNDPFMFCCFSKTPALSRSGEVRSFDEAGDGTMLGEGLGVVVLKRLEDAKRDGNRVYAVIRAVGASSDGRGTAIFAPSSQGQRRAIEAAYREAGWTPDTVELVEAHGTGTAVGDAAELDALSGFFASGPAPELSAPASGGQGARGATPATPPAEAPPPAEAVSETASSDASAKPADKPASKPSPKARGKAKAKADAAPSPDSGCGAGGQPSGSPASSLASGASGDAAAPSSGASAASGGAGPSASGGASAPDSAASEAGASGEPLAAGPSPAERPGQAPSRPQSPERPSGPWCALGSVKSQIGHTKAAAGAAGLIKVVLALHHKVLPPTIKVKNPLPPLREEDCPFYVNTEARPWFASGSHPRRAGVSAFGFGGSNFHCLLEEAGEIKIPFETGVHLLPFSGDSMPELIQGIQDLAEEAWLSVPSESLENERHAADYFSQAVDYHLRPRLHSFRGDAPERIFLAFPAERARDYLSSLPEILKEHGLKTEIFSLPDGLFFGRKDTGPAPALVYFAPGAFKLSAGTGRDLALNFSHFQMILDLFAGSRAGTPLGQLLYPPDLAPAALKERWSHELADPAAGYFIKPALAIALYELYSFFGVKAARTSGQGPGLVAALVISGWLPLKEAVRALGEIPPGTRKPSARPS
jgi:acyl transferase domain-containing protein